MTLGTKHKTTMPFSITTFLLLLCLSSISKVTTSFQIPSPKGLSQTKIAELARKRFNNNDDLPMKGKVAVVTGAAGGIGSELVKVIHSLGGTVIAMDRDEQGLITLEQSLLCDNNAAAANDDDDTFIKLVTHHEDLNSVSASANDIKARFSTIDLLINNAGLGYVQDLTPGDTRMISRHGKDLAFTVNYLSHFLLTEKLLPCLEDAETKGRIVHVTSTFHWQVDGSEIAPRLESSSSSPGGEDPLVHRSNPKEQSSKHIARSYANTKLAQIWHSRSIRVRNCASVCACPTWAATGIAGEGAARDFLQKYAFAVEHCGPGLTSTINAMLRTEDELGDALNDGRSFVANCRMLDYIGGKDVWFTPSPWRDQLSGVVAAVLLFGQKFTHDEFIIQQTSPESFEDGEMRERFYQWSLKEVQPWL